MLFDEIRIKDFIFTVTWMPSHTEPGDDLSSGVSALDVIGNDFADKQAEVAAKQHVVSSNMSSHVLWFLNLASRIQRRLVHIMCSLDVRKRSDTEKPDMILPKQPDIEASFLFSSHVLFNDGAKSLNALDVVVLTTVGTHMRTSG